MGEGNPRASVGELSPHGIIDCYVNGNPPAVAQTHWNRIDNSFLKTRATAPATAGELVETMDACGIVKALLAPPPETAMDADDGYRWALEAVQAHPDRFALSARIDPRPGMPAVRRLESMVRNDGVVAVRFSPYRIGLPPSDRVYFPIYTKCVELDVPVALLTGLMGPAVPATVQDPMHLDEVCGMWPELTVVACHGGVAWALLIETLLSKYSNLYYMLSAHVPRRYPRTIIDYLNSTRGRRKVMFATDYPAIRMERSVGSLRDAPLAKEAWPYFLYRNAERVFWKHDLDAESPT